MKTNEIYIKISGRFPINQDLNLGEDRTILIKGAVVKKADKDLQDGTKDVIITVKPMDLEIVKNNVGNGE